MPAPRSSAQASSVAKPASMATPGQSSQSSVAQPASTHQGPQGCLAQPSSVAKPAVTTIDELAFFSTTSPGATAK